MEVWRWGLDFEIPLFRSWNYQDLDRHIDRHHHPQHCLLVLLSQLKALHGFASHTTIWGHKSTGCCWAGVCDKHHPKRSFVRSFITDRQTPRLLIYIRLGMKFFYVPFWLIPMYCCQPYVGSKAVLIWYWRFDITAWSWYMGLYQYEIPDGY
jgi:hypothetical protein